MRLASLIHPDHAGEVGTKLAGSNSGFLRNHGELFGIDLPRTCLPSEDGYALNPKPSRKIVLRKRRGLRFPIGFERVHAYL